MQSSKQSEISRWWRLVGGLLMNLALGTLYGWSVFVAPLEAQFGWKRAETSMVFTIAVIVFALSFVVAGRIQDKFGPLPCSLTGGILVSLGFYLCSYTTSLAYLYICFGVIGGLGNGFGYATPIPVMAKWFPDKRGLAVGLAVGGYGAGSAIFGPLAQLKLIPAYGLPATFRILGAIFLVMTIIGASASPKSSSRISARRMVRRSRQEHGISARLHTWRNAADTYLLSDVDWLRAGLLGRVNGHQPISAVREKRGNCGGSAFDHDARNRRLWKRLRTDPFRLDVRWRSN